MDVTANFDDLELFRKRAELLVGARLQSEERVKNAVDSQDRIRSKVSGWDGAGEIRKWREARK